MNSPTAEKHLNHPVTTALTLIFFACLVLAPAFLQHEPQRWEAAQAMLQHEEGDQKAALKSLQRLAPMLPDDDYVQTKLVNWLAENGQADEAIQHCNQQLMRDPDSREWLNMKLEAECDAGDFKAAWQTFQQLRDSGTQHVARSPGELNDQAYFRALAEDDLATAAKEIQLAVSTTTRHSGVADFQVPLPTQALVAAGLIARHKESQEIVLPQLSRRIEVSRRALDDREDLLVDSLAKLTENSFPLNERQEASLNEIREKIELRRRELAFLLVCRALICENLDQPDRCDRDRVQVVDLGFEPQLVADMLPEHSVCQPLAMRAVTYLDTRALVLTKMPWTDPNELIDGISTGRDAITDLNIAVAVSEVIDCLMNSATEFSEKEQAGFRKVFAAVLHHRVMANRKAGDTESVALDRTRIESLGFDADGSLY